MKILAGIIKICIIDVVRTTITIDDELFERASQAAGTTNASSVVREALEQLVSMESRKRLLMLSGKVPGFAVPERACRTDLNKIAEPDSDSAAGSPTPSPDTLP